jgi:hypothetical protein
MNEDTTAIISNYNSDPSWLFNYFRNYVVYDQSDDGKTPDLLMRKKIQFSTLSNPGHNLNSIFKYVLSNYENLPKTLAFIKTSTVPRHCTLTYFESVFDNDYFSPFFFEGSDSLPSKQPLIGFIAEENDSWYTAEKPHKYFCNMNDFIKFIYSEPIYPEVIAFIPGANFICESSRLKKLPPLIYRFMDYISSYQFFPSEAYLIERILPFLLFSNSPLNRRFDDEEVLIRDLIDLSAVKCTCSKNKGWLYRKRRSFIYLMSNLFLNLKNKSNF